MASIDQLKASDGSGNASLATVQSVRSPGATTIIVNTVSGINTNFIGSMGTPHTFTDPVTSETITVISEATNVDFKGHVDGSDLIIDTIATGQTDLGSEVGDIVIIKPTTQWSDELAEVLEVSLNDDGTLKDNTATTNTIPDDAVDNTKIDWSSLSLNMKAASNPSTFTIANGSNNLAGAGIKVNFTVAEACKALVTVSLGVSSTTDFEYQPQIRLGGTVIKSFAPVASLSAGRAHVRGFSWVVSLVAGANEISAGVSLASSTSAGIAASGGNISAIVLGEVTA